MSHRLDGCGLRMKRADEHLEYLRADLARFRARDGKNGFHVHLDHDRREYSATAVLKAPLPAEWGIYVGEAVYNMRSALDHLIWQLVIANHATPGKHNQFPVFEKESQFDREAERYLAGVAPAARDIIRDSQPFDGRQDKDGGINPLWLLHELSNIDKHRALHFAQIFVKASAFSSPLVCRFKKPTDLSGGRCSTAP